MSALFSWATFSPVLLSAASGKPFFLYLAFQHTHHPQFASEKFTNTTIRGMFGDSITEMDWAIGQVLETLSSSGVEDNTLVFFTADNGWVCLMAPQRRTASLFDTYSGIHCRPSLTRRIRGGNGGLLRCGKGTTWEGGQRVPGIARWPGRIKPGKTMEVRIWQRSQ